MHYILIDYENVQPDIRPLAEDFEIDVTVFIGPRQRVNPHTDEAVWRMDTRAEVIKVSCAGPNALDFHLAFHLGQLVMADPTSTFEILSNDKGYDSLVTQLAAKGVQIQRTPGSHRPEGYCAPQPKFTPYYLRNSLPASAPVATASVNPTPREEASLRSAIKALEKRLRGLKSIARPGRHDIKEAKRCMERIAKYKAALAMTSPQLAPSGRKILRHKKPDVLA